MAAPFGSTVATDAELRALYREPSDRVRAKKVGRIDPTTRAFIEGSPFCLLATAGADGSCDVSPRGGPPGFVKVLDEGRLALPDLSGNNLLDSLSNIVANPRAGLLLLIPGRDETLRIEGEACLTTDPAILALWDDELRRPKLAVGVAVRTVYIHCAKSFRRGKVWDPASWGALHAPDTCEVFVDQLGLDLDPGTVRASLEASYQRDLEGDRPAT